METKSEGRWDFLSESERLIVTTAQAMVFAEVEYMTSLEISHSTPYMEACESNSQAATRAFAEAIATVFNRSDVSEWFVDKLVTAIITWGK